MPSFTRAFAVAAALAFSLVVFACSSSAPLDAAVVDGDIQTPGQSDGGTTITTNTGLPCDVNRVFVDTCQTCHAASPQSGASTSLVTWDDLQKDHGGKKLYELVKDRIHAETGRMPPAAQLSADQVAAIDSWVASGAPKSEVTCEGKPPPPAVQPFACNAPATLTTLKAAKPYTWAAVGKTDEYVCFGVDEMMAKKRHIIGFAPKVENLNILHHILLFQTDTAMSNEATPCSATTSASWKLVTGWAPGGGNLELPPEAGFAAEGTTHWVLQLHYNNASGTHAGESDNSGYQLCETEQLRPNDAGLLAFGSADFTIPPRTARHAITCDYKLSDKFKGVTFISAWPHMHKLGTSLVTERIPKGTSTPERVYGQDPFNFEMQNAAPIQTSVEPGDVFRTHCVWKNGGDMIVPFGENTDQEMCFNFMMYYPNIPDLTFGSVPFQTWITPSKKLPWGGPTCTVDK